MRNPELSPLVIPEPIEETSVEKELTPEEDEARRLDYLTREKMRREDRSDYDVAAREVKNELRLVATTIEAYIKKEIDFQQCIAVLPESMLFIFFAELTQKASQEANFDFTELANGFVDLQRGREVAIFLSTMKGLDHAALVERLFSTGQGEVVAWHFNKFKDIDSEATVDRLLQDPQLVGIFTMQITELPLDVQQMIAKKMVETDGVNFRTFCLSLRRFSELDASIADRLIEKGRQDVVAEKLDRFKDIDYPAMMEKLFSERDGYVLSYSGSAAAMLIKTGQIQTVNKHIKQFSFLNLEVAQGLIAEGYLFAVLDHLDKFQPEYHEALALLLIKNDYEAELSDRLSKFKDLGKGSACKLIETGVYGESVVENLSCFQTEDYQAIAKKLVKEGYGYALVENIEKFTGVDYVPLIEKVADDVRDLNTVAAHLSTFQGLSKIIANKLMDGGYAREVANSISSFQATIHPKIAKKLMEEGDYTYLVENIQQFEGVDPKAIAKEIIDEDICCLADNLAGFRGLDQEIAEWLLVAHSSDVSTNLSSFEHLDMSIAEKIVGFNNYEAVDQNSEVFDISPEIQELMAANHLTLSEAVVCQPSLANTQSGEAIVDILVETHSGWQDRENIVDPFREGAAIFGEAKMFLYLDRKGLTRHDGLHQFKKIIALYEASNLSADEFFNNILEQAARDNGEYYSGSAQQELNNLSDSLSLDFHKTRDLVEQYNHIDRLAKLAKDFSSEADVFSSWKNLKKYKEIQDLLKQRDILDQLAALKNFPEKQKLREYVETLAFHPNISMKEVFSFWRTPATFLGVRDVHTPQEVHDRKKPSNYVEFPHLDLTAENLRDALVEGSYDALQSFRPLTIEYEIGKSARVEPLTILLHRALGKRSQNLAGKARNPAKLFKEVQNLAKQYNLPIAGIIDGSATLSSEQTAELTTCLYRQDIGLEAVNGKKQKFRAKINMKSDPDAVVAGNDTACCMPFGSGKNNVYTFNPNCSLFTVQRLSQERKWRTIAQSVLTEDIAIKRNVSGIVGDLRAGKRHLNDLLDDDILAEKKSIIACDNIEVASSFKDSKSEIKVIYQDFFREYLKERGNDGAFDDSKIVIGMGYSDALTDLPKEDNMFVPRAPVAYSDKLGPEVYTLSLKTNVKEPVGVLSRKVIEQPQIPPVEAASSLPTGVEPLTFRDALPVAFIEGKAYRENESLMEFLHNMENALIAKDVNNAVKQRPNLSLKYVGDDHKIHGYLLAYEGKRHKQGENVVYISDLASDGNARAGGSLILGFTESYKQNYIDTGKLIPIYAQMRENTSYPIIKKQLDKLAKGTGIHFQMKVVRTYEEGPDVMHEVMITPVNSR